MLVATFQAFGCMSIRFVGQIDNTWLLHARYHWKLVHSIMDILNPLKLSNHALMSYVLSLPVPVHWKVRMHED